MYTIGIISNSPQIIVDSFVSMFGFSDLFSLNIGRGNTFWDIEHIKPDPYLFSLLENIISVENITYIGDMESDRIFAERNNMNYFHLDRDNNHKHGYGSLSEIVKALENGK
jgi:FMN phosphatase YigB (HAD superfamily)